MDLMIDIETLGTEPKSIICSVGWAVFDDDGVTETNCARVDWHYQLKQLGRTVSADTMQFWLKQSGPSQFDLINHGAQVDVDRMWQLLWDIIQINGIDRVWANGPSFDLRLLEDLFSDVCMKPPWTYKQERDFRTIRDVSETLGLDPVETVGNAHNAEHDAINQAQLVINVRNALKNMRG